MIVEKSEGGSFHFDRIFKKPLDTICYNIKNDWDFIILITGSGMTRTGKTTLAQQIGKYCADKLSTPFDNSNIVFGGKQLIETSKQKPHNSVIIDDESREDMSGKRSMEYMNKTLMDFFNECGMYNHLMILVATDFFDFTKSIAVTRSEILFNVTREVSKPIILKNGEEVVKLERGHVDFYDRKAKRLLYINGKKNYDDYSLGTKYRSFYGFFDNKWIIDKEQYQKDKQIYLERERSREKKPGGAGWRYFARTVKGLRGKGYTLKELARLSEIEYQTFKKAYDENRILDDTSSSSGGVYPI